MSIISEQDQMWQETRDEAYRAKDSRLERKDNFMISEQLNPCPFDGSDKLEVGCSDKDDPKAFYWVVCCHCEAQGPTDTDRDKAIEKWNTRLTYDDYLSNQEEVQPAL